MPVTVVMFYCCGVSMLPGWSDVLMRVIVENYRWELAGGRALLLDQPRLMAILNVTPDSFSDGGELATAAAAVEYGLACLESGADLLDLGGESTRPGAVRVSAAEQIERVVPVIRGILQVEPAALISVDTTLPTVAEAALAAGAVVINDVSAGQEGGGEMFALAASTGAGLILMHRLCAPAEDVYSDAYAVNAEPDYGGEGGAGDDGGAGRGGVVGMVRAFLRERAEVAGRAGIQRKKLVLDPGLGFGKTVEQNFELIRQTGTLQADLGVAVLSAASRKSFIGAVTGVENPRGRVFGSVAVTVAHYLAGIRLFRVHDVAAHRAALAVTAAGEIV